MRFSSRLLKSVFTIGIFINIVGQSAMAGSLPSFWRSAGDINEPPPDPPVGVIGVTTPGENILVGSVTGDFTRTSGANIGDKFVSNDFIANNVPYKYDPSQYLRIMPTAIFSPTASFAFAYGVAEDFGVSISSGYSHRDVMGLSYLGGKGLGIAGHNNMQNGGATDIAFAGVWRAYNDDMHTVTFGLGFSVPVGHFTIPFSLHSTDGSMMVTRGFYGYQLGSGTLDMIPTAVYSGHMGAWGWGVSYAGLFPTDYNSQGWRWGDMHAMSGWLSYRWTPTFSTSFRLLGTVQGVIKGRDTRISGTAVSVATDNYGGQIINALGGFSVDGSVVGLKNTNFSFEGGAPVYQWLYGPQPRNSWMATVSLKHIIDIKSLNLF